MKNSLILDIGNTRAKAAVMCNQQVLETVVAQSAQLLDINGLCNRYDIDAAIASVVGCQPDFAKLLPPDLFARFVQLGSSTRLPVEINYDTPNTLGMDRVAAAVGARTLSPQGALVIVDAGSCITVDLLDDNNTFQGGAILPGLQMRLKALHQFTAALPLVTPSDEEWMGKVDIPVTGKSTRASIMAGVMRATVFEIEGFMNAYRTQFGDVKCFLTGGDADFFAEQLFFPKFATPNLLFLGLDKILKINL